FNAQRKRPELAAAAAQVVGFPRKVVDFEMPDPLPVPTWAAEYPHTSASYLYEAQDQKKPLLEMAKISKDPRTIDQIPHLSQLTVSIDRSQKTEGKKLLLYLSQKALTDNSGKFITSGRYIRLDLLDTLLLYPELSSKTNSFTFTYLHPGNYFLTVIADMDGDGYPSPGDITHPLLEVKVAPESHETIRVKELTIQN
ncbi:MAG: hypothetical protein AAGJ31_16385, partial [Verrucomicrobiota bacterium]